jgi:hypothetical protein
MGDAAGSCHAPPRAGPGVLYIIVGHPAQKIATEHIAHGSVEEYNVKVASCSCGSSALAARIAPHSP